MDEFETWFDKGVTDGLPVVPPSRERVEAMLAATRRARDELLGEMPPSYGRVTVEKAAINAVMAGCRPEYLPVLLAAAECACDPAFNLHGVATSTHFSAPLIVVHGPVRARIGINSSFGVFGPGYRANATIGRALRLLMINVGGAKPGGISMSTFGHPGRYTYCIGEHEEASPWVPYHVSRGLAAGSSAVTLFAGEAPHGVYDHMSRTARDLLITISKSLEVISHHKSTHHGDTVVVLSPEHAHTVAGDGWGKAEMREFLWARLRKPVRELIPGVDGGEGLPAHVLAKFPRPETDGTLIAKFREPGNLKFVVAGGTAGRFSAVIPGWTFPKSSRMIWRKIHLPEETP